MTTQNNTKPNDWSSQATYVYGDTVYYNGIIYKCVAGTSTNDNPSLDLEHHIWEPLDIYKKDETVMNHGEYSGDESMWERDQLYVDPLTGQVYINGKDTGINVKGPAGTATISFDSLTPEQRESIKGAKGDIGPQGPQGIQGPQGPAGDVQWESLTPAQIESLRGEQGLSAYEVWLTLPGNAGKSEQEFIADITGPGIEVDDAMSSTSRNPVQNKVIYQFLTSYDNTIQALSNRITELENRLSSVYQGNIVHFNFGVTADGEYGYIVDGTQQVIPFHLTDQPQLFSTFVENAEDVLNGQIGYSGVAEVLPTEMDVLNIGLRATSLSNSPSREITEDDNILYMNNIEMKDFAEGYNAKTYIYRDGKMNDHKAAYTLYHLTENTNDITSQGQNPAEGIVFEMALGKYADTLNIVVEPIEQGAAISYQIGSTNSNDAQLPDLVNGTHRVAYENGTFDKETTITFNKIRYEQGGYFTSTNSSGAYRIKEIYLT